MFSFYLKAIFRNLLKNKLYTVTILTGFSISIAISFLLLAFLIHEYTIDDFHANSARTYRLLQWDYMINDFDLNNSGKVTTNLLHNYGQIDQITHVVSAGYQFLRHNETVFQEHAVLVADSAFFKIFNFELLHGNRANCLAEPYSIVLTETSSRRYFGEADPMGGIIYIDDQQYRVTGILADSERRSHLRFEVLISASSYRDVREGFVYLTLNQGADLSNFSEDINKNHKKITGSVRDREVLRPFKLERLRDCYYTFPQNYQSNVFHYRDRGSLVVVALVMLAIVLTASFNFINFSQARIIFRSKDLTIYSLFGANLGSAKVSMMETWCLSVMSLCVGMILSVLLLPYFNLLTGLSLNLQDLLDSRLIAVSSFLFVLTAFGLAVLVFLLCSKLLNTFSFRTKAHIQPKPIKSLNALIVLQIGVSVLLAVTTFSIYRQLTFIERTPLGFRTENLIDVNLMNLDSITNPKLFKDEVLKLPGIISASVCMGTPLDGRGFTNVELFGEVTELTFVSGDLDYIETLGLNVINGRPFQTPADTNYTLINQSALKYYRLDDELQPLDEQAAKNVIGLIKDYHFRSFREKIGPVEFHLVEKLEPSPFGSARILIRSEVNKSSIIPKIEEVWKRVYFDSPFEYSFVEDSYSHLYEGDRKLVVLVLTSCITSILITLFGLVGIAFFGAQRRLREFAIRRVVGATIASLLGKSIKQAVTWSIVGSILVIPLSHYLTEKYLDNFAYRVEISMYAYPIAIVITALIASASVLYQTFVVARSNPADTLRSE